MEMIQRGTEWYHIRHHTFVGDKQCKIPTGADNSNKWRNCGSCQHSSRKRHCTSRKETALEQNISIASFSPQYASSQHFHSACGNKATHKSWPWVSVAVSDSPAPYSTDRVQLQSLFEDEGTNTQKMLQKNLRLSDKVRFKSSHVSKTGTAHRCARLTKCLARHHEKKQSNWRTLSIFCYTNLYFHNASKVGITFEITYIMINLTQI